MPRSAMQGGRIIRRYTCFLLMLVLSFALVSCGDSSEESVSDPSMRGLGYLSGTQHLPDQTGVTVRERDPVRDVYVYSSSDSHFIRAMDDSGTLLHEWDVNYWDAFDRFPEIKIYSDTGLVTIRRFHSFPDGRLLVNYAYVGLAMLDRDSEVIWSHLNYVHHEMEVRGDTLYVIERKPRTLKTKEGDWPTMDEHISAYNLQGHKMWSMSLYDAIQNSEYYGLLRFVDPTHWDIFHTNDIDLLPVDAPSVFGSADALLSMRHLNALLAIDFTRKEVTWAMVGRTDQQHDPDILPKGNLLIFDNGNSRGQSRIVEIDPSTRQIVWQYKKEGFFSRCCGNQQRLENGNTFVTETYGGRAFEVTPEGEIVWEWINPRSAYGRDSTVAQVIMKRYRRQYFSFL